MRDFSSLTFRFDGKIKISSKEKNYTSSKGSITFVPKGVDYYTEVISPSRIIAVHFDMAESENFPSQINVLTPDNTELIKSLFSTLLEKYTAVNPHNFRCMSLFYEILSHLQESDEAYLPERINYAKNYIDKNFSDADMGIGEIAHTLSVSEVYFRKEFKKYIGISPIDYLNKIRFENARAMLNTGYYTVGEVAEKSGFSSLNYFSSAFKKHFGTNPVNYKKQYKD